MLVIWHMVIICLLWTFVCVIMNCLFSLGFFGCFGWLSFICLILCVFVMLFVGLLVGVLVVWLVGWGCMFVFKGWIYCLDICVLLVALFELNVAILLFCEGLFCLLVWIIVLSVLDNFSGVSLCDYFVLVFVCSVCFI